MYRVEEIPEADKAYFAGLMDGEGSIGFYKNRVKVKGGKRTYYNVRVYLCSTDKDVIKWITKTFGGKYYIKPPDKGHLGKKKIYRWYITKKKEVHGLMAALIPYLKIKKFQAELVKLYFDHWQDMRKPRTREEERDRRDIIAQVYKINTGG